MTSAETDPVDRLLQGRGLVVGPTDAAPQLPAGATAREVDPDGLSAAAVSSQDFIVDPGLPREADLRAAFETRLVKLKPGGVLFSILAAADLDALAAALPAGASAEIAATSSERGDVVFALRKAGGQTVSRKPAAEPEAEVRELKARIGRLELELEAAGRELERVKRSRSWRATEPLRAAKARLGGRT